MHNFVKKRFTACHFSKIFLRFIGHNPSPSGKDCLVKAIYKIKNGELKLFPHPTDRNLLHRVECHYLIEISVRGDEMTVIDVIPMQFYP